MIGTLSRSFGIFPADPQRSDEQTAVTCHLTDLFQTVYSIDTLNICEEY